MLKPLSWALLTHANLLIIVTAESSTSHRRSRGVAATAALITAYALCSSKLAPEIISSPQMASETNSHTSDTCRMLCHAEIDRAAEGSNASTTRQASSCRDPHASVEATWFATCTHAQAGHLQWPCQPAAQANVHWLTSNPACGECS